MVAWGGGGSVASAGAPRPPLAYAHLPAAAVPPRRSSRGHNSGHVDVDEAGSEATEKTYCDEQIAKTEAKREELNADIAKMTAKISAAISLPILTAASRRRT